MDITGLGSIADFAKTIIDKFFPPSMTGAEKAEYQLKLQAMIEARESAIVEAQKSIMVAEMNQSDNYTKRARPTLVYAGLVFIALVHVIFPMITFWTKETVPTLTLPEEFWWAWTGVCAVWIVGRSVERFGNAGKVVGMITGNK